MGKYYFIIFFLISNVLFAQSNQQPSEFKPYKIAIIDDYRGWLTSTFSGEKRFTLVDNTLSKQIFEEWSKRMSGVTNDDNSSELYLYNADYFCELKTVNITGPFYNPETKMYSSSISGNIRVIDINKGSKVSILSISSSGSGATSAGALTDAQKSFLSKMKNEIQQYFPIKAGIFDVKATSLKFLAGSEQGITSNKKFFLEAEKSISVGGNTKYYKENVGLIEVKRPYEDFSEATIIKGNPVSFQNKNITAKEAFYKPFTAELNFYYNLAQSSTVNLPVFYLTLTSRTSNFTGFNLGLGWGGFGYFNSSTLRFSVLDLSAGYRLQLHRSIFLDFGATLHPLNFIYAATTLLIPGTSYLASGYSLNSDGYAVITNKKVDIMKYNFAATANLQIKALLTNKVQFMAGGYYTYAPIATTWKFTPSDKEEDQYILRSIKDYSKYIPAASSSGFGFTVGFEFFI